VAPKKKRASFDASRLKVLAAGDEVAYREHIAELLLSGDRPAREAALDALIERPMPKLREQLRALYREVDGEGGKLDPGAHLRIGVARILLEDADVRDVDIGLRATETREASMGVDGTANLRALGLRIVAATEPDIFPYVAAEHVNDYSEFSPEPASTALQLLAGTGHEVAVYQWLVSGDHDPSVIEGALDLLQDAPAAVMSRSMRRLTNHALDRRDEALLTKVAETIVNRELEDAYPALASIMEAPVSKELYGYLSLLLAGTNRPALLEILEAQAEHDTRRRPAILDALRIRTTPEQRKILDRWEKDRG
jgi:hypothetical protein